MSPKYTRIVLTVNPKPEGPLRNIIGGFKLVIKGTSRQGEFNALLDPGDFACDPLQLVSKNKIKVRYYVKYYTIQQMS